MGIRIAGAVFGPRSRSCTGTHLVFPSLSRPVIGRWAGRNREGIDLVTGAPGWTWTINDWAE